MFLEQIYLTANLSWKEFFFNFSFFSFLFYSFMMLRASRNFNIHLTEEI